MITSESEAVLFNEYIPFNVRPLGIVTATTWMDVANLTTLIDDAKIRGMVEIGVYKGGMASLMLSRIAYDPGFRYLGIEIDKNKVNPLVVAEAGRLLGAEIVIDDCFDSTFITKVKQFVNATVGTAMVFCDGVNKPKEIKVFSKLVRVGDFILTHDYNHAKGTDGNPRWADIEPYIESGEFSVAVPDGWPGSSLFLIQRIALPNG